MRTEFINTLYEIAKKDKNVILITGDLGFGVLDKFANDFPKQFINAGVAEQNMTGLATGLALEGKIVFTYSIANFPTLRCLEQIRNDVCYHNANVKIVSVGGGFSYGPLGISHHATEDLSIMRALPNMTVVAPGDTIETKYATKAIYEKGGPCYLRLGRSGEGAIHKGSIDFQLGKAIKLYDGNDIVIISTGSILKEAVKAREILSNHGYSVSLYSMHTLKPLDKDTIIDIANKVNLIVTIEENTIYGGLGSAVAEVLAQVRNPRAQLKIIGISYSFSSEAGNQEYLRDSFGLSSKKIAETIEVDFNRIIGV